MPITITENPEGTFTIRPTQITESFPPNVGTFTLAGIRIREGPPGTFTLLEAESLAPVFNCVQTEYSIFTTRDTRSTQTEYRYSIQLRRVSRRTYTSEEPEDSVTNVARGAFSAADVAIWRRSIGALLRGVTITSPVADTVPRLFIARFWRELGAAMGLTATEAQAFHSRHFRQATIQPRRTELEVVGGPITDIQCSRTGVPDPVDPLPPITGGGRVEGGSAVLQRHSDCAWYITRADGVRLPVADFGPVAQRAGQRVTYRETTNIWFADIARSAGSIASTNLRTTLALSGFLALAATPDIVLAIGLGTTRALASMAYLSALATQATLQAATAGTAASFNLFAASRLITASAFLSTATTSAVAFTALAVNLLNTLNVVLFPSQVLLAVSALVQYSTRRYPLLALLGYMKLADALLTVCNEPAWFDASVRAGISADVGRTAGSFTFVGRTTSAGFWAQTDPEGNDYVQMRLGRGDGDRIEGEIDRAAARVDALYPSWLITAPRAVRLAGLAR